MIIDFVIVCLSKISVFRVGGFDNLLNWVLKEFFDILVLVLIEVLN